VTTVLHDAQQEFRETLRQTFQQEQARLARANHP
jgi:hypothetical protein